MAQDTEKEKILPVDISGPAGDTLYSIQSKRQLKSKSRKRTPLKILAAEIIANYKGE